MRATIATATDPNRALARLSPYIRKHINVQLGIADPSCVKRAAGARTRSASWAAIAPVWMEAATRSMSGQCEAAVRTAIRED